MPSVTRVSRLLDAALNRAREAARSAEDYARFVAGDAACARRLKALRHALGGLSRRIPLSSRDVEGDSLRHHTPASESRRRSPEDVAAASLKRLQEALRSIEEFSKLSDPGLSRAAKRLRFEAYRIESDLWASPMREALAGARLYAVLSPDLMTREPVRAAAEALRGGVQVLQLRWKAPDGQVLRLANRIAPLCRRAGVPFILNDRVDLALACGADGVHLGQSDLGPERARPLAGRRLLIGRSTHTARQIARALKEPVDYLAFGPVFPTLTKPNRGAVGPGLLGGNLWAIGGITRANLPRVLRAGARRVAVTGAVFRAPDVAAAARALLKSLGRRATLLP